MSTDHDANIAAITAADWTTLINADNTTNSMSNFESNLPAIKNTVCLTNSATN
jgi:hypothetical protein